MELALRHGALRERIAAQRRALASHAWPLESALGGVDRALAGVDWLKAHPAAVGVAVARCCRGEPEARVAVEQARLLCLARLAVGPEFAPRGPLTVTGSAAY